MRAFSCILPTLAASFGQEDSPRAILIMAAGGTKNRLKPELRGFGVPALAGGPVALASALKFFEVILFASTPPPEGGTPNLHPLVNHPRP